MNLISLFQFVLAMSKKYNIDPSHSELHSMDVLHYAHENINSQIQKYPYLENQTNVIYISCILHDMCDKKYLDAQEGCHKINNLLAEHNICKNEIEAINKIINSPQVLKTMGAKSGEIIKQFSPEAQAQEFVKAIKYATNN